MSTVHQHPVIVFVNAIVYGIPILDLDDDDTDGLLHDDDVRPISIETGLKIYLCVWIESLPQMVQKVELAFGRRLLPPHDLLYGWIQRGHFTVRLSAARRQPLYIFERGDFVFDPSGFSFKYLACDRAGF